MKKHFSLFLAVLFLFTAGIPMTGVYAAMDGAGTAEEPYLIKTEADLLTLNGDGSFLTVYRLENNLTLSANRYITAFAGILDGNGKTVTINLTSGSPAGLIGTLKWGSTVKNLTVAGTVNVSGNAGGIAGKLGSSTKILNCVNKANITGAAVAGIAGDASGISGIEISGCRNEGTIIGTGHAAGISANMNNGAGTISGCSNAGAITSSGYANAGGIAGYANKIAIDTCYNIGAITHTAQNFAGGISGGTWSTANGAAVANSFNAGTVTIKNGAVGPAIAYSSDNITNSYNAYPGLPFYTSAAAASGNYNRNDGSTTAQSGVALLSYAQMKDTANFAGFDFTDTWTAGTEAYPFPQLKNNALTGTVTLPDPPAAPDFETGTGSKADPYIIKTADEFKNMAKEIYNNASSDTLKYFKLGADIVLNDYTPFVFAGHLDGDNHVVTVNINLPEENHVGLFRGIKTWGSGISNLVIDGTIIGKNYVGGLIGTTGQELGGQISSGTTIENITNRASVTAKGEQAGGIFGRDYGGQTTAVVRNLRNEGTVKGTSNVGGIAGVSNHSLNGCSNAGAVTSDTWAAGGILGWGTIGIATTLENCYNTGVVTGSGCVGGIVGSAQYKNMLTVQNSYNAGVIQSTSAASVAGIIGKVEANTKATVKNCYSVDPVRQGSAFNPIVSVESGEAAASVDVTNCYYPTPCGETATYGTPKTLAELKGIASLLGSAFAAGSGAYLYPQLTANSNPAAAPEYHVLTINAGEHGTVVPGCALYIADGRTQTITLTADEEYTIGTVKYNGLEVPVQKYEYTTPEIKADASLAVTFVPATVPETVTPFATPFYSAGEKFGIVFAAVTALPTEYGMLISKTAQTAESLVDGAEGVIKCAAVTPASANGQYGIKFDKLEAGTYYTRAYAAYAGGMVYGASIVEIVIE